MGSGNNGQQLVQNQVDKQGALAQTGLDQANTVPRGLTNFITPNYQNSVNNNLNDYNQIQGGYNQMLYGSGMNPAPSSFGGPDPAARINPNPITSPTAPGAPPSTILKPQSTNPGLAPPVVGGSSTPPANLVVSPTPPATGGPATPAPPSAPSNPGLGPTPPGTSTPPIASPLVPPSSSQTTGGQSLPGGGGAGGIQGPMLGGFTPAQVTAIQQQAQAPSRAIEQNAQNDLQTQKALTGGYMPNAGAASAQAQRIGTQGATAGDVQANAQLAQQIQQGNFQGLAGQTAAYGAQPGLTSTLGNQALGASGQQMQGSALQNQIAQMIISGQLGQSQVPSDQSQTLGNIGSYASLFALASSRDLKMDILPFEGDIFASLQKLTIHKWRYIGEDVSHIGPMAEDFHEIFGVGDGKTISLIDVMGIMIATCRELAVRFAKS